MNPHALEPKAAIALELMLAALRGGGKLEAALTARSLAEAEVLLSVSRKARNLAQALGGTAV